MNVFSIELEQWGPHEVLVLRDVERGRCVRLARRGAALVGLEQAVDGNVRQLADDPASAGERGGNLGRARGSEKSASRVGEGGACRAQGQNARFPRGHAGSICVCVAAAATRSRIIAAARTGAARTIC